MQREQAAAAPPILATEQLCCWYGATQVLFDVTLGFSARQVTVLLGPSGSGKSVFLRCLTRLNDLYHGARTSGRVLLDGHDIYALEVDVAQLRQRIGLVLQSNSIFPGSIYANLTWAPRLHGVVDDTLLQAQTEDCLRRVGLWGEVAGRLETPAGELSGGQQQRLCIARALALKPEILLLDEPVSALDAVAVGLIADLICELKQSYTVITVTHDHAFAQRIADHAVRFEQGRVIAQGPPAEVLNHAMSA